MIAALALLPHLFSPNTPYESPAGSLYAQVIPGGTTILPNGRFLTPVGQRWYTSEDLWKVLVSPDGTTAVGFDDRGLTVYERADTNSPIRKVIPIRPVAPAGVFSKDGQRLYVSLGDAGKVAVYDTLTWAQTEVINLVSKERAAPYAVDLQLTPDQKSLIMLDVAHQELLHYSLQTKQLQRVKAGREPYALSISPDGKRAYVANIGLFDYSVVPAPEPGKGNPRGLTKAPFGFPSKESVRGVELEGRKVPPIGSPYVVDAHSVFAYDLTGPVPVVKEKVKTGILIHSPADAGDAVGGSAPNAILATNDRVYVCNGNNDTVQTFNPSLGLLKTTKLVVSPELTTLRGVIPSALALTPDGKKLYVAESGLNSVAILDSASGEFLGRIPSGWFPNSLAVSPSGKLFVGTQKGIGRGPRGTAHPRPKSDERYGMTDMPGMIQALQPPGDGELAALTQAVRRNTYRTAGSQTKPTLSDRIKHVVFITKENHTFDGIFGEVKGARGWADYAEFGMNGWIREKGRATRVPIMPNHIALAERFGISDNFYMEPQASGDGHRWLVGVYPSLWTSRVFYAGWGYRLDDNTKGRLISFGSDGSQIPEDYLENGSIWEHLDRGKVSFRNYGEGFELPDQDEGEPFSKTGSGLKANYPMPKVLFDNTCWEFPAYNNNIPDIARADWFMEDIAKIRKRGKPLPKFLNIAICNDHGAGPRPKEGYPYVSSFMADNDLALGQIVDYLSKTPEWKSMAIFVTQDDSGGDSDHIDRHRSFVLCISPWAKKGYVSKRHTSIMSIHKTIYSIFGLGPNNLFDALANDLGDMFTDTPDFRPYKFIPSDPRVFKPEETFDPADPEFKKRRLRSSIPLDDASWLEKMRNRASRKG